MLPTLNMLPIFEWIVNGVYFAAQLSYFVGN